MTARRINPAAGGVLANLLLSLVSILLVLLLCETVVFRWILQPSAIPRNAYIDGLIRLEPNQSGVLRIRNEIAARYQINAQGWNSGRGDYTLARTGGRARIAIIGDSYVEALQVPATDSLAEQLQRRLDPAPAEVYRFGISGAPLSQYLFMLEREVVRYAPDLVALVLAHNDFDESFRFKAGRYTSSFMKLALADGRVIGELPPLPYQPSGWELLRASATLRYLYYRQGVNLDALKGLLLSSDRRLEANIDVQEVQGRLDDIRTATDYLFGRLAATATEHGIHLLLLMDANRQLIYGSGVADSEGALTLNAMARDLAAKHGIPFIDLHPRFAAAWRETGERFEFLSDNHWNQRGHAVAAEAIDEFLHADPLLASRLQ